MSRPFRVVASSSAAAEGPYEISDSDRPTQLDLRVLDVVEFVARIREDSRSLLPVDQDLRELGIVLELVRNHLTGRLTTVSSLAHASGLSYGTAIRTIDDLVKRGFIERRPRTGTGKSFSLHPSASLLRQWQLFAGGTRRLIEGFATDHPGHGRAWNPGGRTRPPRSDVIPLPSVLKSKLALSRGLRVLVHADPTFMAMNALKRQFELILGVDIHVRALSIDRLRREIVANSERRMSDYDVVACDYPWFGEMASKGRLLPLDDLLAGSDVDLEDFIPDALASARWNDKQFGIPVMATAEMLVYRSDLLSEAGVAPPRTLRDLIEVAQRLNAPERDVFGIAWNGGRGTALGHTFITIMAAHGQPIVNLQPGSDGFEIGHAGGQRLRPMFLTEAARETANALRDLVAFSPPEILSMVWYDRARAFATGRVALAYSHTLLANLFERDPASPAYRKVGYVPHPTGLSGRPICVLGGYGLSIPENIAPERIPAVWQAIKLLTSASAAKLYIVNGSLASPRFSVSRDPEVKAVSPVIDAVDAFARNNILRVWPRPPVPGISAIIQIAGEEIHDMLLGVKSIEQALVAAQERADAHIRLRNAN